jgi:hypothetical protein
VSYFFLNYQTNYSNLYMAAYTLKQMPDDVRKFILSEQKKIKAKKGVRIYGIDLTVYHLLKELMACRAGEKTPVE